MTLVEGGAGKMLRAYVLVGEQDPSRDGAAALVDLFVKHKLKAELDLRPGLGHAYPDDMAETLPKALAFVTT
jgi:acetyl esterase/lipase